MVPALRHLLFCGNVPSAANLYNALEFRPDTIGSVGGSRVSPYDGSTVAASDPITRPLRIGSRSTLMYLAQAAATNLAINNATFSGGWGNYGPNAETTAQTPEIYGDTLITPQRHIVVTANSTRGRALSVNPALSVGPSSYSITILVRRIAGVTPCDFDNYLGGPSGLSSSKIATAAQIAAQPAGVWVLYRFTRTYTGGTPGQWGLGRNGGGAVGEGFEWALPTLVTGSVPPPLIVSGGSAASITADNIRRAALDIFPAGSPRLSQPWTMSWWVMLEGHSIGATGHVSVVAARHWDCNTSRYVTYPTAVDRVAQALFNDDTGAQSAQSSAAAAPDVAGTLAAYVLTYTPSVGLFLYRNGILIASDPVVGTAITAWANSLFFGNVLALNRALSGWMSAPHFLFGTALTADQIAAQHAAGVSAP